VKTGRCEPLAGIRVIDPADQSTWPDDILDAIRRLAADCRGNADNTPGTPSYELSLSHVDAGYQAEEAFRDLLDDRPIALFHATRLLSHERDVVLCKGLMVLDEAHRFRRLDRVIDIYGEEVGVERLERLRNAGPLSWDTEQRRGRLGLLWGVTPLQHAFDSAGDGMTVFLEHWGGECFYRVGRDPELEGTIALLTDRSVPSIVEVALRASSLNTYTKLWPIFVAQLDGWQEPWHQFSTQESIPPERVLEILDPASPKWPLRPG
jgi:hypothetical protein